MTEGYYKVKIKNETVYIQIGFNGLIIKRYRRNDKLIQFYTPIIYQIYKEKNSFVERSFLYKIFYSIHNNLLEPITKEIYYSGRIISS